MNDLEIRAKIAVFQQAILHAAEVVHPVFYAKLVYISVGIPVTWLTLPDSLNGTLFSVYGCWNHPVTSLDAEPKVAVSKEFILWSSLDNNGQDLAGNARSYATALWGNLSMNIWNRGCRSYGKILKALNEDTRRRDV